MWFLILTTLIEVTHLRYPLPTLTPGDVLITADKAAVCKPGYTANVRSVSDKTKQQVFERYGIEYQKGKYEVDHFISLELGGSNDIKNLWPESYPEALQKDVVENHLHHLVCTDQMSLKDAQDTIKFDWYKVYIDLQQKKEYCPTCKKPVSKKLKAYHMGNR